MKTSKPLIVLSCLVALLALIYAGLGLFWLDGGSSYPFTTLRGQSVDIFGQGVYRNDMIFFAAGFRGTDMVTVFLAVPLMLVATWFYGRGSLRGGFLLLGSLAYMLYNAFSLGTSAAYNPLFLLYVATFAASWFAFFLAWRQVDFAALSTNPLPKMPRRGVANFLFISGGVTALLWMSDLLPPLLQGNPPALLGPYTTAITYFIDLGVITPLCMLAGMWLLRRDPRGSLAGFALLYLLALMGFIVLGQTTFQINAGIMFSPGQLIGMIGSWIVMGGIAIGFAVSILAGLNVDSFGKHRTWVR